MHRLRRFLVLLSILAVVVADILLRYPEDTNAPWPAALLFYPAIGFVAEILFHVVPLALLMLLLAVWSIIITGHILSRALDIPFIGGIVLGVAFFVLNYAAYARLFPAGT